MCKRIAFAETSQRRLVVRITILNKSTQRMQTFTKVNPIRIWGPIFKKS